jgi:uncharacterized integral membrane protein
MGIIKLGLWVIFTITVLIFSIALISQNNDPITITIFNYTSNSYAKWLVLLLSVLAGAILTTFFFVIKLIILETRNVRLRRANSKLERALATTAEGNGIGPVVKVNTPSALEEEV